MNLDEFIRRGQFAQKAVDEVLEQQRGRARFSSYSVGDYVFARNRTGRLVLARVENARPNDAGDRWQVRERSPEAWRPIRWQVIERSLTPTEIAHNRKLGLIPKRGERP